MDDEKLDRIVAGTLATIAGGATSIGAPPLAPAAIILTVLAVAGSIFASDELVSILKWILVIVVILIAMILLFISLIGYWILSLFGLT